MAQADLKTVLLRGRVGFKCRTALNTYDHSELSFDDDNRVLVFNAIRPFQGSQHVAKRPKPSLQLKHCQERENERAPASHVRAILNRLFLRGLTHYIKPGLHLSNTCCNHSCSGWQLANGSLLNLIQVGAQYGQTSGRHASMWIPPPLNC